MRERVKRFYERDLIPVFKTGAAVVVFGHGASTGQLRELICPDIRNDGRGNAVIHHYTLDGDGACLDYRIIEDQLAGL